jgi:Arc/MetJ-type ribon-helix-helix transcriptional regulator
MFDYSADAEFFPRRRSDRGTSHVGYQRFASAADAIRFAIEELPPKLLTGSFLEVNDERLGAEEIRQLYNDDRFPLPKKASTP